MITASLLLGERLNPGAVPLEERFALADAFFRVHPGPGRHGLGLGRAVVDFMRWEATSGRLADNGGSPWWRAVNGELLTDLAEAAAAHRLGEPPQRDAVAAWLAYTSADAADAQARLWHAHQASLDAAVARSASLLARETQSEREFAGVALAAVADAAHRCTPTDSDAIAALTVAWYPSHYPVTSDELDALRRRLFKRAAQDGGR